MLVNLAEALWTAVEFFIDALTWAFRVLFGDPRPVTVPVAGLTFRDPEAWARANRHVGYHDPDRELN